MYLSLLFGLSLFVTTLAQNVTYEAEDAILNGTAVDNSVAGFTGTGYVTGFWTDNDSLTFNISIPTAASYDLYVTYQASFGEKYTALLLNGASLREIHFPASDTFATTRGGQLSLVEGYNVITFASNWGWYSIDSITISPAAVKPPPEAFNAPGTFEAEDAILNGITVSSSGTGYSGTGYVTGFTEPTYSLTFNVSSASTALYEFSIAYSAPYGEKYTSVSLNGVSNGQVHFIETSNFTSVSGGQLLLNEGYNTITFSTDWGWYIIDGITLTPASEPAPHQVSGDLVNPNATDAAKTLMRYLVSHYGKHLLTGQQDPPSYAWVQENVGKSPAIIGLDMIDYSPTRVEHGTVSRAVEDAIAFDANNTIVNFAWHWNAPTDLIDTEEQPWWSGFYTRATTFDLEAALADKTGEKYTLLIRDIDAIAVQLKRLQDANVPVVWRPLHEADGGWFWWGRDKKPEPCKELYRILYDRLTNHHGLNNLIWVWNSVTPSWYPGDDVVDIVSYDSYPSVTGDHGAVSAVYNQLVTLGQNKKLVALAEVGPIPDPDLLQAYNAYWSYFVTWNGEFISGGTHNSLDFLKKLYNSDYVYNWDDIQGWKETP